MRMRRLKDEHVVRMRKCPGMMGIGLMIVVAAFAVSLASLGSATVVYYESDFGDLTTNGFFWLGNNWDLTLGDMTVAYTLDMSGYLPPMWNTAWSSVGVGGGAWGWMSSGAPAAAQTEPNNLDMDDKLNLGAPDRYDESSYDATDPNTLVTPPIGNPWLNYGVWFDRDGVDSSQATMWGSVNGATYNTAGQYDVVVTYHSIDAEKGTMFATVNGVKTGFYDGNWKNAQPENYPIGKSIVGNLQELQVFASLWGENVKVFELKVSGYVDISLDIKPGSMPNSINLRSNGVVPAAVLGSDYFDVGIIDVSDLTTIKLAGAPAVKYAMEDVNGDGYCDALFFFDTSALQLTSGSTSASLEFYILTDPPTKVVINDYVNIVGKPPA